MSKPKPAHRAPAEEIAQTLAAIMMKRGELDAEAAELAAIERQRHARRQLMAAVMFWILMAALLVLAACTAALAEEFTVKSAKTQFVVKSGKPSKAVHAPIPGQHSHRCPIDGTIWKHGDDQQGAEVSHRCPKCGRLEWKVYDPATAATLPVFQPAAGNCPGGICPTPTTRRGRR